MIHLPLFIFLVFLLSCKLLSSLREIVLYTIICLFAYVLIFLNSSLNLNLHPPLKASIVFRICQHLFERTHPCLLVLIIIVYCSSNVCCFAGGQWPTNKQRVGIIGTPDQLLMQWFIFNREKIQSFCSKLLASLDHNDYYYYYETNHTTSWH